MAEKGEKEGADQRRRGERKEVINLQMSHGKERSDLRRREGRN